MKTREMFMGVKQVILNNYDYDNVLGEKNKPLVY